MSIETLALWWKGQKRCHQCQKPVCAQAKFCPLCGAGFEEDYFKAQEIRYKWECATIAYYHEVLGISLDGKIFAPVLRGRPQGFDWPIYDSATLKTDELFDRSFPGKYSFEEKYAFSLQCYFPPPEKPTLVLACHEGKLQNEYAGNSPLAWRRSGRTFMTLREWCIMAAIWHRLHSTPVGRHDYNSHDIVLFPQIIVTGQTDEGLSHCATASVESNNNVVFSSRPVGANTHYRCGPLLVKKIV